MLDLICFKNQVIPGCDCSTGQTIDWEQVLEQVRAGNAPCPRCGVRRDLRNSMRVFAGLGQPEALFGLDLWLGRIDVPADQQGMVHVFDPRAEMPYEGRIVYATLTPGVSAPNQMSFDQMPALLAPQAAHHSWAFPMRFYAPPGGPRKIDIMVVLKPDDGVDLPLDLAIQSLDAFHRDRLNVACILLSASIEASFRRVLQGVYSDLGVEFPGRDGFSGLLERARTLLQPQLGSSIVGQLRELAKVGRNPAAHGGSFHATAEQVGAWMVDAATIYEWTRRATLRGA